MSALTRLIAFYLPQFHPIPENDAWWGNGFTEWTNVAKARPLFRGHHQPHLPADLGFYDLRLAEAQEAQVKLARQYGIHGFCYYHYWFNGRRLLERPFQQVLDSGKPDFPFCLCWANENWTRRWDGQEEDVLLGQNYSPEDDLEHIRWLSGAFKDSRYIRIGERPLFMVYRLSLLPDPSATVKRWRAEAQRLGVGEIYVCNVESFPTDRNMVETAGLDGAVEFAPDSLVGVPRILPNLQQRFVNRLLRHLPGGHRVLKAEGIGTRPLWDNFVYDYNELAERMQKKSLPAHRFFRCVTPGWDNTARRPNGGAYIFRDSTPERYGEWLSRVIRETRVQCPESEQVVFVNAWNEWAEGNHLEPCSRWGHQFLDATREAVNESSRL